MKKFICFVMILTVLIQSFTFATGKDKQTIGKLDIETIYYSQNDMTNTTEEIIKIKNNDVYYYSYVSESRKAYIGIKNNAIVECAILGLDGKAYSISQNNLKFVKIGFNSLKKNEYNASNLLEHLQSMHKVLETDKYRDNYLVCIDEELKALSNSINSVVTTRSISSDIYNDMIARGYEEFNWKVVANISYNGQSAQVHEQNDIQVFFSDYFVGLGMPSTWVSFLIGLPVNPIVAAGLFLWSATEGYISASDQQIGKYTGKWIGDKYVSFWGQGNYYQTSAVSFEYYVSGAQSLEHARTAASANTDYFNNYILVGFAYLNF